MHTAFGSLDYTPSRHQSASRMSGVAPQPVHRSLIHYAFRKWGPFPESYVSLSKNMIKCCAAALIPPSKRRSWDLFYYISGVYGENSWYFSVGRDDGVDRTQSATKAHQQTGELLHEFPFEDRQSKPERPSNQRFPKWSLYPALLECECHGTEPTNSFDAPSKRTGNRVLHKWIYMNKIYSTPMNAFFWYHLQLSSNLATNNGYYL